MNDSKKFEGLSEKWRKRAWWLVRHGLAFGVGALASNADRVLDRLIFPADWDAFIKMFASLLGQ
jgi:hypothetical protein